MFALVLWLCCIAIGLNFEGTSAAHATSASFKLHSCWCVLVLRLENICFSSQSPVYEINHEVQEDFVLLGLAIIFWREDHGCTPRCKWSS